VSVKSISSRHHIQFSKFKKCLRLDPRCTDERILSIFPKFLHPSPSNINFQDQLSNQKIEEILEKRKKIKEEIDKETLDELEKGKDNYNELIRK